MMGDQDELVPPRDPPVPILKQTHPPFHLSLHSLLLPVGISQARKPLSWRLEETRFWILQPGSAPSLSGKHSCSVKGVT